MTLEPGSVAWAMMEREHAAWRAVCRELDRTTGSKESMNTENALHAAITLWGEELALLRLAQDNDVKAKAHEEAKARYNREIGFLPY